MKPALKVLQMLVTASSVTEMGGGRFSVKWGNHQESIIYVYDARLTKRAPDAPKRGAKVVKSKSKVIKGQARR